MDQYDGQFIQAMIQLGICDENYANQLIRRQKQLVAKRCHLSITEILLQFRLASPEQIQRVQEFLGSQKSAIHQFSRRSSNFSPVSPSTKSPSQISTSETQQQSTSPTIPKTSRFIQCSQCGKKVLRSVDHCPYCKASFGSGDAPYRRKATPLVFYLSFGGGAFLIVVLMVIIFSGVRFSGDKKSVRPVQKIKGKGLTEQIRPSTRAISKIDGPPSPAVIPGKTRPVQHKPDKVFNTKMALLKAVKEGKSKLVQKLLSRGLSVNQEDEKGWTLLHWAVWAGKKKMVQMLLQKGALAKKVNHRGETPIKMAWKLDRIPILQIFALAIKGQKKRRDFSQEEIFSQQKGIRFYQNRRYHIAAKYLFKAYQSSRGRVYRRLERDLLNYLAMACEKDHEYQKAGYFYQKALSISIILANIQHIATGLGNIGMVYRNLGKPKKSLETFRKALTYHRFSGDKRSFVTTLSNFAMTLSDCGKYRESLKYFQKALDISKKINRMDMLAYLYNNIGHIYKALGQFDRAAKSYKKSQTLGKRLKNPIFRAIANDSMGGLYQTLGQYPRALYHFKQALKLNEAINNLPNQALNLSNMGMVYSSLGKPREALKYLQIALKLRKKIRSPRGIAITLNALGMVYADLKQSQKANQYYRQAYKINLSINNSVHAADNLNNMGEIYFRNHQYSQASKCYTKTLSIYRKTGQQVPLATALANLALVFHSQKKYQKSKELYWNSLNIVESLRKKLKGQNESLRRDYLAIQIRTYLQLFLSLLRENKLREGLGILEISSGKYLREQMGQRFSSLLKERQYVEGYLKKYLHPFPHTAILYISQGEKGLLENLVLPGQIRFVRLISSPPANFTLSLRGILSTKQTRGLKINWQKSPKATPSPSDSQSSFRPLDFQKILRTYRNLLQKSPWSQKEQTSFLQISRYFYQFLFGNIQKYLHSTREILVIPQGLLSYIPFETMIMPDGRYMVEKYKISYIQSLGVLNIIDQRRKKYSKNRKPLLLFGGATYEKLPPPKRTIVSEKELRYVKIQTWKALSKNPDLFLRNTYHSMNYYGWEPLPATALEIRDIQKIVPGSRIFSGSQASESRIKQLSRSGVLKQYRILHFATHGVALPDFPELSALVLSQFRKPGKEDGYLRMGEIARLKLQADFVNLSACETGLGKIYGGEGVVGLTQAFLIAGANGLSVSLWQVADESTRIFMVEFYRLVFQKKMAYRDAMVEVKRKFIRGDFGEKYKAPFFWAPFVYYGR